MSFRQYLVNKKNDNLYKAKYLFKKLHNIDITQKISFDKK
jgi:hypothetical protein